MIRLVVMLLAIIVALTIVGTMDAEDADRDFAVTCSMIEAGAWPAEVEPNCGESQ